MNYLKVISEEWTIGDRERLEKKCKRLKALLRKIPEKQGDLLEIDFKSKVLIMKINGRAA